MMSFINNQKWQKKKRLKIAAQRSRQSGVGMIEVLVALLISAFALLGLAGLQVISLKYQKVAQFRSLASQTSADMADRIRANARSSAAGDYVTHDDYLTNRTPSSHCKFTSCTPRQIAAVDLFNWRTDLRRSIAGGWGNVTGDATNGLTLTVYFSEPNRAKAANGDKPDPNCAANFPSGTDINTIRCFKTVFVP
ncbi:type IV pilus modification protein PilV [Glaciimonas sp. Gout2]|uniref:type IV pilus modification protein PilV n=2 Tax=Glaciimonas TaxID=1229970 RepID=UPI002AB4DFD6|nr:MULTISPECIES: type IV pilus modification protein PilV [unclassified Glaciimonas]MDY7547150.1 type IV pilus modification protein PilV [Glaciimonas sp. CA11.2]MEB0011007.1 type IV pilus modification protein PilV [Glaciimonas sp. Cout2]MEB0083262.1 type IV pilus modification protein PilV [Glaciimonas sp. Gout2]